MDKTIYYKISDTTNDDEEMMMKISTKGFPIEEKIEYDVGGNWVEEFETDDQNLKGRLNSLLEDNNIRLIMDLLQEDDEYYNNKYNLRLCVQRLEVIDDY